MPSHVPAARVGRRPPARTALALTLVSLLAGCAPGPTGPDASPIATPVATPTAAPTTATPGAPPPTVTAAPTTPTGPVPSASPTTGTATPTTGPLAGTTVPVQVVRRTSDDATAGFVPTVMAVLGDERGWSRAGFTFVLDDAAPYTIVLGEGDEVDRLCLPYDTGGRYSCQNGAVVALNADRWRTASPGWTGTLEAYRTMLVNHEVGHLLHLHHPSPQCPGDGLPAPVMLQQSTELGACTANPWPLPWEVDLAAARLEALAPPAEHDADDHRPTPPAQQQDLAHRAPTG